MKKVRHFYTTGEQDIVETLLSKNGPDEDQIEVRSKFVGICRSDIDMYMGLFPKLPIEIQGHEGLGVVTQVGKKIKGVIPGDFVATRSDCAYADFYNARDGEFVRVPELSPKYILEPVACGINIYEQARPFIRLLNYEDEDVLILGTGFLATVLCSHMKQIGIRGVEVVGNSNLDKFKEMGVPVLSRDSINRKYRVVIDLTDKIEYFPYDFIHDRGILVIAAEKHPNVSTSFSDLLWKALTVVFPSPRNERFINSMSLAEKYVTDGIINTEDFWSKSYKRSTEVHDAFKEGQNRPAGYSRGYLDFDK